MAVDPLEPGARVPDFTLPDSAGARWTLSEACGAGRALLVFHRGSWCFLSRRALAALRSALPAFAAKGCAVAAISMEPPDKLSSLARRLKLTYALLSDPEGAVVTRCGVTIERRFSCPFPAVLLIGHDGRMEYRHDGRSARDWPDWQSLARHLEPFEDLAPQTR